MFQTPPVLASLLSFGFELIFYLLFLFFVIYSVMLAYHWFSYGTNYRTGLLSLAVYLLGSVPFLLIMSVSF